MDGMELDTEKGKKRKMITNHRGRFPEREVRWIPIGGSESGDNTYFGGRIHGKLSTGRWRSLRHGIGLFGVSRRIDQKDGCLSRVRLWRPGQIEPAHLAYRLYFQPIPSLVARNMT